jgi:hypothetical protein
LCSHSQSVDATRRCHHRGWDNAAANVARVSLFKHDRKADRPSLPLVTKGPRDALPQARGARLCLHIKSAGSVPAPFGFPEADIRSPLPLGCNAGERLSPSYSGATAATVPG